jgi:trehalose utilization protein
MSIRVTVWNEYRHEVEDPAIRDVYPNGIHGAIATGLQQHPELIVRTATLDQPDNGLPPSVLDWTDVLTWWGHRAHKEVSDETVDRVQKRVLNGMGLVVLHSGHESKLMQRMMGTSCALRWREANAKERLWIVNPGHPIVDGIPEYFEIAEEEMYGEHFDIPQPDELIMISWFTGGEVFRSGCCFYRGRGKIFYFRPGHESYPTYFDPTVRAVIANGVRWAAPGDGPYPSYGAGGPPSDPLEPLPLRKLR